MKIDDYRESSNVEVRGGGRGGLGGMFGGGGARRASGGIGIGTIILAILAYFIFDINPMTVIGAGDMLGGPTQTAPAPNQPVQQSAQEQAATKFTSQVLASTEDVWGSVFQKGGAQYQAPKMVIYQGGTRTACGIGQAAMGPFYCPGDQTVYIDLEFYDTLQRQMGAGGDFAQAYVVAHEVGHHVQHLLGIHDKVDQMRGRLSERENNALSVRVELQADCFAGVWARKFHENGQRLDQSDIQEAMNAAAKIGDDALQRKSQGVVVPDSFTHGSSEQRMRWFNAGLQSGDMNSCDTFKARQL